LTKQLKTTKIRDLMVCWIIKSLCVMLACNFINLLSSGNVLTFVNGTDSVLKTHYGCDIHKLVYVKNWNNLLKV